MLKLWHYDYKIMFISKNESDGKIKKTIKKNQKNV